jgi:heat shock protein HslJ
MKAKRRTARWAAWAMLLVLALAAAACARDPAVHWPQSTMSAYQKEVGKAGDRSGIVSAAESSEPTATLDSADLASLPEVQEYAEDNGIDLDEAVYCFEVMDDAGIDRLEAELSANEADTFGGLWFEHRPAFRIVVAFTRDGERTIERYLTDQPWAQLVEVRTVPATYRELQDAERRAARVLRRLGIEFYSDIHIAEGDVEVNVTDEARLDAALHRAGVALPEQVHVMQVAQGIEPEAGRGTAQPEQRGLYSWIGTGALFVGLAAWLGARLGRGQSEMDRAIALRGDGRARRASAWPAKRKVLSWIGAALAFTGLAVLVGAGLDRARVDPRLWAGRWELVSLRGEGLVEGGRPVTLRFYRDGFAGWTTCNRYGAWLQRFGDGVADWERPVYTTDILCLRPELAAQEQAYLAALDGVVAYEVGLSRLVLMDRSGETVLVYRRRWMPRLLD